MRFQFLMSSKFLYKHAYYALLGVLQRKAHKLCMALAFILRMYSNSIGVFDRQIIPFHMIMSFQIRATVVLIEQEGW